MQEERSAKQRRRGRPPRDADTTELRFYIDNTTLAKLDDLTCKLYDIDEGQGRRNSTIHYLLKNLTSITYDPTVQRYLSDNSLTYGGDIMRLFRDAIVQLISQRRK